MTATGKRHGLRVLVLSDQAIPRAALAALIRDQPNVADVIQAARVGEVIHGADTPLDVILVTATRSAVAVGTVAELTEAGCATPILALADEESAGFVRRVLGVGASGVVMSTASPDELAAALLAVADGASYVHPSLGAMLAAQESVREIDSLSPREREVLRLIALGYTNPEIAERLVLSVRTIETHRAHLARKLDAETRAQLVRHALNHGLLNGD